MSTNAIIQIENSPIKLYKHWDGYPEATLDWLKEFNQDFAENRGDDPEYKIAQLVRSSVTLAEKYNLDNSKYTGWGLLTNQNWNADYTYTLKNNGEVEVK